MKPALARLAWVFAAVALVAGAVLLPGTAEAGGKQGSGCIAHRPAYVEGQFEVAYKAGCSGHDEPELDPLSNAPGSAKDFTWKFVLPADGSFPVAATGPTFWFGGTVSDPTSLFGQAFLEVQFYPDSIVTNCTPNGGFVVKYAPNTYSVCSPVWSLTQTGTAGIFHEPAAFNAMLTTGSKHSPLVMHALDTITIHFFVTSAKDGWHIKVTDLSTGGSGTIVLNSKKAGPLLPEYSRQQIGNSLKWGIVHDTPNSFVWEIGHTSPFTSPASAFCLPGEPGCYSYDAPAWGGTTPIDIKSVTFGDGSTAQHWAAVSDYGGKAEVEQYCGHYGGPFCIYPWYSTNTAGDWHYGVHFPDTVDDYGKAGQFAQDTKCNGPFGPTYCDTILK
ncbi:MAG TPA: hypothetical protein VHV50_04375 [Actinomycetota bacterium]|nr:hypothetical protein [Actinomycetota bacterium]